MIVEGGGKYGVRLIPQTCNREDAIREIVGALDHLNAISDEIFSTIRTRLSSQRHQMECLSQRVSSAAEQVASLKGSQKAIRIISPAKYPCDSKEVPGGKGAFGQGAFPALVTRRVPDPPVLGHDVEESEEDRGRRPMRFDAPIKHPNDLLSIFHVRDPNIGDLAQLDSGPDVGLGKPPAVINNMDSFFLFNTVDNPYLNYKMTERSLQDRNFGTLKPARKGEEVQADVCPAVSQENDQSQEQKTDIDDFYYSPSALEIPNIDVPEHLPDLPGIAENLDLMEESLFPRLFPGPPKSLSLSKFSSQPSGSLGQQASPLSFLQENDDEMFTSTPIEAPSSFQPRPSPPSANTTTISSTASVPPPPPPPPPPVVVAALTSESESMPQPSSSSRVGGSGDLRSSLMAAIREAGGSGKARLRSAKDKKYEAKKKKQDEKEKGITTDLQEGGDLMADLKNSLAMRRRGISGIQDGQKQAGVGDIMRKLAATIPAMDSSVESAGGLPGGGSDDDEWD